MIMTDIVRCSRKTGSRLPFSTGKIFHPPIAVSYYLILQRVDVKYR